MVITMIQDLKPESGFYNNMLGHFGHTAEVRDSGLTLYDHSDKLLHVCCRFPPTFPRYTFSLSRWSIIPTMDSTGQVLESGISIPSEV